MLISLKVSRAVSLADKEKHSLEAETLYLVGFFLPESLWTLLAFTAVAEDLFPLYCHGLRHSKWVIWL